MVYQQTFPVTGPQSAPYYIDRRKRKPMYDRVDSIIALLPQRLRKAMLELPANTLQSIREIRLRSHRFAMLDVPTDDIYRGMWSNIPQRHRSNHVFNFRFFRKLH